VVAPSKVLKFAAVLLLALAWPVEALKAQSTDALKPDPLKEQMYLPYLAARHGGFEGLSKWKESNTILYYMELWYFCESFSIKRNHFSEGQGLNEAIIDITRFESHRKAAEPAIVQLPGFKDALVLLPESELIHKPVYQ
jgi:hypothetical protein